MGAEQDEILKEFAETLRTKGWTLLPRSIIGAGGGGTVYTCVRTEIGDVSSNAIRNIVHGNVDGIPGHAIAAGLVARFFKDFATRSDLVCAVKFFKNPGERSTREVEALGACAHPNLVRLVQRDPAETPQWFVMEYHPRGTIESTRSEYKGRPLALLRSLRPIVEATAELHKKNYVHRDIKLKNIFLAFDKSWILGDLGIAFNPTDERITEANAEIWSRDWNPDWVAGRALESFSKTVDVFMLVKVFYAMLTGRNVRASQLEEDDCDPRKLFPTVPRIDDVFTLLNEHMVTREADCRSKDASELLEYIDSTIARLDKHNGPLLVFQFLSGQTAGDAQYGSDNFRRLTNIPIQIANGAKALIGRIRAQCAVAGAVVGFSIFRTPGDKKLESNVASIPTGRSQPGTWLEELRIDLSGAEGGGWYFLDVDRLHFGEAFVSGLVLYAE